MVLRKALRLGDTPRLAFVGAGGKTSAIFHLASSYTGRVIITTTTHFSVEQSQWGDYHFIPETIEDLGQFLDEIPNGIIILTGPFEDQRATGLSLEILTWLDQYCHAYALPMLVEADGSKQRPLKAPAQHEPAIPPFVQTVVVTAGVSSIGNPLNSEWVHRPENYEGLSGLKTGERITPGSIVKALSHPDGGLKGIPVGARKIVFLNQVDTPKLLETTGEMAKSLLINYDAVIVGSVKPGLIEEHPNIQPCVRTYPDITARIHAVHEPVAGIILAAGSAQRYGRPKQLLEWHGKPLVWHATRKALVAGLQPVIVVSGAYSDLVERVLADLEAVIVYNPEWRQGQSTSVRKGVRAIPPQIGGAVIFLADQPQTPVQLVDLLLKAHAENLTPIVVPTVEGRRGNPVLFDKDLFPELMTLTGDAGGRQLFWQHDIFEVEWDDPSIFLDIDTPDDYRRLIEKKDIYSCN
jgi:molybdenum cofactor cytidylyltransferase